MFKKASESVHTSTIVVSPNSMPPAPSASSAMKMPENIEEEEEADDPESACE
jgi:hypothetical protein